MERPPTQVDVIRRPAEDLPADQPATGDPTDTDGPRPGETLIRVIGDLDAPAVPQVQAVLATELTAGATVVLDLAGCEFLDSVGIGVLVFGWQTGEKVGAAFRLRNVPAYPQRVLSMVGLDALIPIG